MGRDLEQFVHPERISSQLICPICTMVLKNPVQTSTEHLFCEEELLEWMTRSNLCPITKTALDPSQIRKPSRIILNMLAELQIYCNYRGKGCKWIGTEEHLQSHLDHECIFHQNFLLQETVEFQNSKLLESNEVVTRLEMKIHQLQQENAWLKTVVEDYQERLRLFHALLPDSSHSERNKHVVIAESDEDPDNSFCNGPAVQRKDYIRGSPSYHADFKTPDFSSAGSSPSRSTGHRGSGSASAKQVSDVERLQRLQGLRSLTSATFSTEERKEFEEKNNRK